MFEVTYLFQRTLTTLFTLSIVLGISRVVMFVGLALIQRAREKRRVFPVGFTPSVSVIIAAYNEEKVIARTVQALLDGGYPRPGSHRGGRRQQRRDVRRGVRKRSRTIRACGCSARRTAARRPR